VLVGIGIEASTNKHWAHSCHEFRYYEKLLIEHSPPITAPSEQSEDIAPVPPDSAELIRRAIARLSANKGDPWVLKAAIRPMVKRLDPTFDEKIWRDNVRGTAEAARGHVRGQEGPARPGVPHQEPSHAKLAAGSSLTCDVDRGTPPQTIQQQGDVFDEG
jgi:hypothetical protein